MKLNLLAIGTKMPTWITNGYQEYAKRLPKECSLILHEIAPAKRSKKGNSAQWVIHDSERILAATPDNHHVVALDIKGKAWNTNQLAGQLSHWQTNGRDVSLMVGGSEGLGNSCLQRANQRWSLSKLTLPHPLVRVVIAEQLYRAWTILQHHPYHRA